MKVVETKLKDRGQVTVPSKVRSMMGLKIGEKLIIYATKEQILIRLEVKNPIKMSGILGKEIYKGERLDFQISPSLDLEYTALTRSYQSFPTPNRFILVATSVATLNFLSRHPSHSTVTCPRLPLTERDQPRKLRS